MSFAYLCSVKYIERNFGNFNILKKVNSTIMKYLVVFLSYEIDFANVIINLFLFQKYNEVIKGEELHAILDEIDTNQNGQVELDEYLRVSFLSFIKDISSSTFTNSAASRVRGIWSQSAHVFRKTA